MPEKRHVVELTRKTNSPAKHAFYTRLKKDTKWRLQKGRFQRVEALFENAGLLGVETHGQQALVKSRKEKGDSVSPISSQRTNWCWASEKLFTPKAATPFFLLVFTLSFTL
jgi:hypothetical protein